MLLSGFVGVLPTDTLYGLVGCALKKETVERIYKLRKRELKKPMIVLVSSIDDLEIFNITLDLRQKGVLKKIWPGKVSVVLECRGKKFQHLHRGKESIAFRVPSDAWLRKLLKKTGPLVAPSANLAGEKPAATYAQARKYFDEKIDFYVDFGRLSSKPSTLINLDKKGTVQVLREGAVKI